MEMQSKKLAGAKKGIPVQQYLDIAEIKDDLVVLKDKSVRAVLAVSSINFALKGEDEQNALISAYAQFLNTLEYPVQIVIQSRKLNIDDYLNRLKVAEKQQVSDLLRMQITDYISFVRELVDLGQIMSKRFYVTVPYSPISDRRKSFWSRLTEVFTPLSGAKLKGEHFAKLKETLLQRVARVESGLSSLGLKVQMLDTQALIELYYQAYNPDLAEVQKISDVTKIGAEEIG
ncbi:MAG: TraC family protein [bacterium]|nr:TraC family protein [bacterium]